MITKEITLKDLLNLALIEDIITMQEYLRMEELEDKELKEELIKVTNREWRINTTHQK
jgi:hypothetical protein